LKQPDHLIASQGKQAEAVLPVSAKGRGQGTCTDFAIIYKGGGVQRSVLE
jgi:hypothetical protein